MTEENLGIRVADADAQAREGGNAELVFRVTLTGASSETVTVNYATADATAVADEDYTEASGTLTFAPGETEKTVRVAVLDDTVEDGGETFRLILSGPSGGQLADSEATATIRNSESSVSELEGNDLPAGTTTMGAVAVGGAATGEVEGWSDRDWFAVTLQANVQYRLDVKGRDTGDGTLTDPYLAGVFDSQGNRVGGTENEDGGEGRNSRMYFVPDEDGTYYVAAGSFWGFRNGTYTVAVTAATPSILVADAEASEGDDGTIVFLLTLDGPSTQTVTVSYATADGTATAGGDYTATSGTLTFAPGETEKTVSVAIIDDEVEDSGETFRLVLSSPTNAVLADSEATGTIHTEAMDDHPADTATTGMVAVGGTATGEIDRAGDRDWFAVTLDAGTRYRVDLKGSRTADGTLDDPYLRGIHDVDGNLIHGTGDDDGGYLHNSLVYYTPDAGGTYYISAGGYGRETGTYELSVAEETL